MKVIMDIRTEDKEVQENCFNKVRQLIKSAKETGVCLNVWERAFSEVQGFVEKKKYGWKIIITERKKDV